ALLVEQHGDHQSGGSTGKVCRGTDLRHLEGDVYVQRKNQKESAQESCRAAAEMTPVEDEPDSQRAHEAENCSRSASARNNRVHDDHGTAAAQTRKEIDRQKA